MADRAFPRTAYTSGVEVGQVFAGGQEAEFIFGRGTQILPTLGAEIYGRTIPRMVLDNVGEWFEIGFSMDHLLSGNAAAGFTDSGNYFKIEVQQSLDLVTWNMGRFSPAPVPVVNNGDGTYTYWSRSADPRIWKYVKTDVTAESNRYGKSITEVKLFGVAVSLPNFPYAMPAAAATFQADLRSAGYTGAVVSSTSAALSVECRRHYYTSGSYNVDTLPVTLSGSNVTMVKTATGANISLPSYPYAMPSAAATLQAHLIAAGQAGAVINLYGDPWAVFIPDRDTILSQRDFTMTITPGDPFTQYDMFGAASVNTDNLVQGTFGNLRATSGGAFLAEANKQFARLKITGGSRYDPYLP